MCHYCGCGDTEEYDDDLDEIAADEPEWAFGTQYLRDLIVDENGESLDRGRGEDTMSHIQDQNYEDDVYTMEFSLLLEEQERARQFREENPENDNDAPDYDDEDFLDVEALRDAWEFDEEEARLDAEQEAEDEELFYSERITEEVDQHEETHLEEDELPF